jgi:hypothetical protein
VSLLLFTVKPPIYTVSLSKPASNKGLPSFSTFKAPALIYSASIYTLITFFLFFTEFKGAASPFPLAIHSAISS